MAFPTDFLDLLKDETRALLYLATVMPDGSPQVTPVWFSIDGEDVLINTNEGRVKDQNMKARPQVAMVIQDPKEQDRYLGMRGEVVEYTKEGADEHINRLSLKYYDRPWKYTEGQRRIIFRIKPLHFDLHND
ncbi:MAG TPA: TIGR03618 family F420-dependent PPOX class oxidoreductase [Anaerolineales bacterium]|nr:TIGR03618 family F420-dependent PPOX class oxidoreductase [Anaerolineales bacterium]